MVRQGTLTTEYGPKFVDTIGVFNETGWTDVLTVPPTAFLSGTGNYAILVGGNFGDAVWTGTPSRGTIEVGISDDATPGVFIKSTYGMSTFPQPAHPRLRSLPFLIQYLLTPAIGTWNGARSLVVRARMNRNGDPPNWAGAFSVSEIFVLIWDLGRLGAPNYFAHIAPFNGAASEFNLNAAGDKTFSTSPAFGTSPGEKWLCFTSWDYEPGSFTAPPKLRVQRTGGPTVFGSTVYGMYPRGGGLSIGCHQYKQGGWFLHEPFSPAGDQMLFAGRDLHDLAGERSRCTLWQLFAVRVSHAVANLSIAQRLTENSLSDTGLEHSKLEQISPFSGQQVLLFNQTMESPGGGRSFTSFLRMEDGSHSTPEFQKLAPYAHNELEGVSLYAVAERWTGPLVQHRFGGKRNPFEPVNIPPQVWRGIDVCSASFDLESSPNNVPYPGLITGADIVVAPGFEGPGLGALAELPIQPSFEMAFEITARRHSLDPEFAPYRQTWPAFLGPRASWSISWIGLSKAQVSTLSSFFHVQDRGCFKWRPPTATALLPFAIVEGPNFTDAGRGVFNASARFLELRYTGP